MELVSLEFFDAYSLQNETMNMKAVGAPLIEAALYTTSRSDVVTFRRVEGLATRR